MADPNLRRLSTRDKNLYKAMALTPDEQAKDILQTTSKASIDELLQEMKRTRNPAIMKILEEEYDRTMHLQKQVEQIRESVKPVSVPEPTKQVNLLDRILNFFSKE